MAEKFGIFDPEPGIPMDYEIETYLNVLRPDDTTAGGGSASAIARRWLQRW